MADQYHKIDQALEHLAFDVDKLDFLPDNPKRGLVERVKKSFDTFGQRKPIVARKTKNGRGVVLAGNTSLRSVKDLGWTHVAVLWVEDDDTKATSFSLMDNRSAEGDYDLDALYTQLSKIEDDFDALEASGYDLFDIQHIIDQMDDEPDFGFDDVPAGEDDDDEPPEPPEPKKRSTILQYAIIFDDEDQQQAWFNFVRWLNSQYPDEDTVSGRLFKFLESLSMGE